MYNVIKQDVIVKKQKTQQNLFFNLLTIFSPD